MVRITIFAEVLKVIFCKEVSKGTCMSFWEDKELWEQVEKNAFFFFLKANKIRIYSLTSWKGHGHSATENTSKLQ